MSEPARLAMPDDGDLPPTPPSENGAAGAAAPDLLREGEAAELRGDHVAAAAAYKRALSTTDQRLIGEATFRLGRVAWRQGRLDDAAEMYERARTIASEVKDDELRAAAENGIGSVHCQRSALTQARASFRVALDLTQSPALRGRIQVNLGVLATLEGDAASARELYQRGAQAFQLANDDAGLALALHNLGLLHADAREWPEADEAFERCLALAERTGDRQLVGAVLLNQAELACARERPADALACCERAVALFTELGDEVGRAMAMRWKGEAFRRLRRPEDALPLLRDAIRLAGRLQLPLLEAESARELGLLHMAGGDGTSASKWLRRALVRFKTAGAEAAAAEVDGVLTTLRSWRSSGEQRAVRSTPKGNPAIEP